MQKFGADLGDAPVPSARTKKMKKKKKKKNALATREELLIGGSEAITRKQYEDMKIEDIGGNEHPEQINNHYTDIQYQCGSSITHQEEQQAQSSGENAN